MDEYNQLDDMNFQLWAWFDYQYLVALYILIMYKYPDISKFKFSWDTYQKFEEIFITRYWVKWFEEESDIVYEWNWRCFEDFNILKRENGKTKLGFFQSKGWNNNKGESLTKKKDRTKILYNFLKNVNYLETEEDNFFVINTNLKINNTTKKVFSWINNDKVLASAICWDIENYLNSKKIPYKLWNLRKLENYIEWKIRWDNMSEWYIYWDSSQPLYSYENQQSLDIIIDIMIDLAHSDVFTVECWKASNMWKDIGLILWISTFKEFVWEVAWIWNQSKNLSPIPLQQEDNTNERYFIYKDVIWDYDIDSDTSFKLSDLSEIRMWKIEKLW